MNRLTLIEPSLVLSDSYKTHLFKRVRRHQHAQRTCIWLVLKMPSGMKVLIHNLFHTVGLLSSFSIMHKILVARQTRDWPQNFSRTNTHTRTISIVQ